MNKAEYDILIRYSSPNQRSCYLYVDQIKRGDYSIDPTDSWNDWRSESLTVSLEKGKHQIKIVVVGDGGPNIDSMIITGQASMDSNVNVNDNDNDNDNGNGNDNDNDNDNYIIHEVTALAKDGKLSRGQFILSPNNHYKIGLVDTTGELVVMDNNSNSIKWSNGVLGGQASYMQGDGNLVVRNDDSKAIWNTESSGNDGAHLTIDDSGIASIVLTNNNNNDNNSNSYTKIWTTTATTRNDNDNDNDGRYDLPTFNSGLNPNFRSFAEEVVLKSRDTLSRGEFISSPSNKYSIGLDNFGDLHLQDSDRKTVWKANVEGCDSATMQPDGNLVLRDGNNKLIWTTHTSKNPGAHLVVDDGGRLSVLMGQTAIWMQGGKFYVIRTNNTNQIYDLKQNIREINNIIQSTANNNFLSFLASFFFFPSRFVCLSMLTVPRGAYTGPSSRSLQFPLRGMFYYPWYPETWSVNSKPVKFVPDLGKYSSGDGSIVEEHIDAMEYAYTDISIASWWGPGTSKELSRMTLLMDKTIELNSSIKWTVYYEDEMFRNPSIDTIRSDLDYLKKWFVWHPAWANVDDKPVIFVYNEAGCSVNERWMQAAKNDWYVVLKVFPGHTDCEFQPDSWHQYGPSTEYIHIKDVSTGISPGFWRADMDEPKLPRVSRDKFCENTKKMVEAGEDWQLITTFNEAGEGTLVEASSDNWGSDTKYGYYLDCLNEHH